MTTDNISPKKNDASPFQRLTSLKLNERPGSAPADAARAAANAPATAAAPVAALTAAVSNISETSRSLREIQTKENDRIKDPPPTESETEVQSANEESTASEVRDVDKAADLVIELKAKIQKAPEQAKAAQADRLLPEVVQNLLEA